MRPKPFSGLPFVMSAVAVRPCGSPQPRRAVAATSEDNATREGDPR